MGKIIILDEHTANKIAAGEVVERPASIVKELCENSIDAGAKAISVEIKNGGISFIKIVDNGFGISKDDVEISFEKHSTSKIRSADDLMSISSMGFRGEALASISAVSYLEMITKTADEREGSRVVVEGGNVGKRQDYGCPVGTTIIVKDLFFNTPARYKFLKKDYTEAGYVEDVVTMLALGNPEISFKLVSNGSLILQTPGNDDILSCAYSIFGNSAKSTLQVDFEHENVRVFGLAGKPEISRSNRSQEMFFINSRIVKNKTITSAVEEAYKTLLQTGRYPFVILNISINPQMIDVNVHPTKQEVRFSDESQVFSAIFHAVKNTLLGSESLIPENNTDNSYEHFSAFSTKSSYPLTNNAAPKTNSGSIFRVGLKNEYSGNNYTNNESYNQENYFSKTNASIERSESKEAFHPQNYKDMNVLKAENDDLKIQEERPKYLPYKIIGTAFSTYILIEMEEDFYIIDQHAAHERVMFEKLREDKKAGRQLSQMILVPEVIELKHKDYELVNQNKEVLFNLGIIVEDFGENSIKVNSVPYLFSKADIRELLFDLIDGLEDMAKEKNESSEEKLLYRMACKSAVKANTSLSIEEITALIKSMNDLENPYTCPHGRPTAIKMTKREIEKKFGRT
ncbi:MAG: DNA mismatch repair endonuclease MutL [Ignavibacteriales bacterium]